MMIAAERLKWDGVDMSPDYRTGGPRLWSSGAPGRGEADVEGSWRQTVMVSLDGGLCSEMGLVSQVIMIVLIIILNFY